jgi:hypothetical protein
MAFSVITMPETGDHDGVFGDHDEAQSVITMGRYAHPIA